MTTTTGHVGLQKLSASFVVRNLVVVVGICCDRFVTDHEITRAVMMIRPPVDKKLCDIRPLFLNVMREPKGNLMGKVRCGLVMVNRD